MRFLYAHRGLTQTDNFEYIDWARLCQGARTPWHVHKSTAPIFCPHDAPDKTKDVVLAHNHFTGLVADIDSGDWTLADIERRMGWLGLQSWLAYSTASHMLDDNGPRWRVVIELAAGAEFDRWAILQTHLMRELGGDDCAVRPQQVSFWPNYSPSGIYEDGAGAGPALHPLDYQHRFVQVALRRAQAAQWLSQPPPRQKPIARQYSGESAIAQFNRDHDIATLLDRYGFKRVGPKWVHPASSTGIPGAKLLDGKYFSHHGCDRLGDGKAHDAFDLFAEWEHDGNEVAALAAIRGKK